MGISGPVSIFADYQKTFTFQISSDWNPTFQIAKLDSLYMRLHSNNCDVSSVLRAMTLLSAIPHLWDSISASILSSYTSISDLTWDIVHSAIQAEFYRWTNTTDATHNSGIPHRDKPSQ